MTIKTYIASVGAGPREKFETYIIEASNIVAAANRAEFEGQIRLGKDVRCVEIVEIAYKIVAPDTRVAKQKRITLASHG